MVRQQLALLQRCSFRISITEEMELLPTVQELRALNMHHIIQQLLQKQQTGNWLERQALVNLALGQIEFQCMHASQNEPSQETACSCDATSSLHSMRSASAELGDFTGYINSSQDEQ